MSVSYTHLKADLVAVGGVTGGCGGHDLALGQLAGDGLGDGDGRVGRTLSLIHI